MKSIKSIEPAVTICEFDPYVSLLSRKYRGSLCDGCFKENKLTPCRKCSVFKYCSTECEEKNAKNHRHECAMLKKNPSKIDKLSDCALFLLRLHLFSKSEEGREASDTFFKKSRKFEDLMSHEENILKDVKKCHHFAILCGQIEDFIDDKQYMPEADELLRTFGKMVINSFSILNGDFNAVGTGIYLGASYLDHDCNPNCITTFSGTKLLLRSIRKVDKNEELTICYTEQTSINSRRQRQLLEMYYFCCKCKHCTDTERDAKMIGLLPGEEKHQHSIDQECALMEAAAIKLKNDGDNQAIYEISKKFFSKWSKKLRPQSIYVYKSLDLYFDACIDLKMWDKIISNAPKMIKIHRRFLPNPHPKQAIDTLKYAKILLYVESYAEAMEYFKKAEEQIKFIFGSDSSLAHTAAELKLQCLMEERMHI